jgi:tRNA(adenine34) deaminase
MIDHTHFMNQSLKEALRAFEADEIPIGAIVVAKNQIIARGYNQTQMLNDSTAHAEIIALTSAFSFMNSKYLKECTLYVTIEPCAMCAGALRWSQIGTVVYGAKEEKCGFSLYSPSLLHPKTEIIGGIEEQACKSLMQEFFAKKRK